MTGLQKHLIPELWNENKFPVNKNYDKSATSYAQIGLHRSYFSFAKIRPQFEKNYAPKETLLTYYEATEVARWVIGCDLCQQFATKYLYQGTI